MTKKKIKGYEKYNIEFENDPELAYAFKLSLSAVDIIKNYKFYCLIYLVF